MLRTFLDSGVLLTSAHGSGRDPDRVLRILENAGRTFVTSPFIRLELEAAKSGLAAMDALHIAAAQLGGPDEFVTQGTRRQTDLPIFPHHTCLRI